MKQALCLALILLANGMLSARTVDDVVEKTGVAGGFCAFPLADSFVAVTSALAIFYLAAKDSKAILFGLIGSGGLMAIAASLPSYWARKISFGGTCQPANHSN